MSTRTIEDVIRDVLKGGSQENALSSVSHLREIEKSGHVSIAMHDEKDESGWNIANMGFMVITGGDDFPGPWTMWVPVNNIGEKLGYQVDDGLKAFAWAHVSPCGSCGGSCTPGVSATIFGKQFENTCQANLMFTNPDVDGVGMMKRIFDIRKGEIKLT